MKPKLRQTLPKPIPGNNQYPGELVERVTSDGQAIFVPIGDYPECKVVDHCLVIDTMLGIFARERSCDTIYLRRDSRFPGLVFSEF